MGLVRVILTLSDCPSVPDAFQTPFRHYNLQIIKYFIVRAALYAYKTPEELAELEKIYNEDQSKCILNKFYQRLELEKIQKPVRIVVDEWELYYLVRKDEIIFMVPGTR